MGGSYGGGGMGRMGGGGYGAGLGAKKSRVNTAITRTPMTYQLLTPVKEILTGEKIADDDKIECVHDLVLDKNFRNGRPVVFWLTAGNSLAPSTGTNKNRDAKAKALLNDSAIERMFDDERVRAALLTSCVLVQADGSAIDDHHPYAQWLGGEALPRLVVFSGEHEQVARVEAPMTSTVFFEILSRTIETDFAVDVEERVREFSKLRQEGTNIEDRIAAIDRDIEKRGKSTRTLDTKRANLVRQAEENQKQLDALFEMPKKAGATAAESPEAQKNAASPTSRAKQK